MPLAQPSLRTDQALARYLGLEDLLVLEELLTLAGSRLDARILPFLAARLAQEEAAGGRLARHGYLRMAEKNAHLVASLRELIAALEEEADAALRG